jgi:hypothetical protein
MTSWICLKNFPNKLVISYSRQCNSAPASAIAAPLNVIRAAVTVISAVMGVIIARIYSRSTKTWYHQNVSSYFQATLTPIFEQI